MIQCWCTCITIIHVILNPQCWFMFKELVAELLRIIGTCYNVCGIWETIWKFEISQNGPLNTIKHCNKWPLCLAIHKSGWPIFIQVNLSMPCHIWTAHTTHLQEPEVRVMGDEDLVIMLHLVKYNDFLPWLCHLCFRCKYIAISI